MHFTKGPDYGHTSDRIEKRRDEKKSPAPRGNQTLVLSIHSLMFYHLSYHNGQKSSNVQYMKYSVDLGLGKKFAFVFLSNSFQDKKEGRTFFLSPKNEGILIL